MDQSPSQFWRSTSGSNEHHRRSWPRLLLGERNEAPIEFEWNKLIIATGARELFLPFPGWTLPGVMGPGGLLSLVKNGWPISGKTVAIAGSGPLLLATAAGLQHYGAKVISISEQAPFSRLCSFSLQLAFSPSKCSRQPL